MSHEELQRIMKRPDGSTISSKILVDWFNFMRDLTVDHYNNNPQQIRGVNVVELDETAMTKRKYERGRLVKHNQWVVGGVQRNTEGKRCFVELVEKRDAKTMKDIVLRRVLPGTYN